MEGQKLQEILLKYKLQLALALLGSIFIGMGAFVIKANIFKDSKVEIIEATSSSVVSNKEVFVDVSGAVNNPGVYKLESNSRVSDSIAKAGGLSGEAALEWVSKNINQASLLVDGQKIYIPSLNEQTKVLSANITQGELGVTQSSNTQEISTGGGLNINTASKSELEKLWGIGPVSAQKIIEQRPYSTTQELVNKKIVKSNVYERIKNEISVY